MKIISESKCKVVEVQRDAYTSYSVEIKDQGFGTVYGFYCTCCDWSKPLYFFYSLKEFLECDFVPKALKDKVVNA